jgi:hypothetical protein
MRDARSSCGIWHSSRVLAKVVVYGYLDGRIQIQRLMFCVVGSLRSLVNGREEKSLMANCARDGLSRGSTFASQEQMLYFSA